MIVHSCIVTDFAIGTGFVNQALMSPSCAYYHHSFHRLMFSQSCICGHPGSITILQPILCRCVLSWEQQQSQHQDHLPTRKLRQSRSSRHEYTYRVPKLNQIGCHRLCSNRQHQQAHRAIFPWLPFCPQLAHQRPIPCHPNKHLCHL